MIVSVHLNGGLRDVEVDVKPCPFCGSAPRIKHIGNQNTRKQSIQFKCSNSSCRVERTDSVLSRMNLIDWMIPKSVEHWNRRPDPIVDYNIEDES